MSSYFFIAHDPQEALAAGWASWVAAHLPVGSPEVVLPLKEWALGAWESYLETRIAGAQRILIILSPGFLSSQEAFVRYQRRALLQRPVSSDGQRREPLVALLACPWQDLSGQFADEQVMRQELPLLFTDQVKWVDLSPIMQAEEAARLSLLAALPV